MLRYQLSKFTYHLSMNPDNTYSATNNNTIYQAILFAQHHDPNVNLNFEHFNRNIRLIYKVYIQLNKNCKFKLDEFAQR